MQKQLGAASLVGVCVLVFACVCVLIGLGCCSNQKQHMGRETGTVASTVKMNME